MGKLHESYTGTSGRTVCIYSGPGLGKTTLAAGMAQALHEITGRPTLYHDWDGGAASLEGIGDPAVLVPYSVDSDNEPIDEMWEVLELLKTGRYNYCCDTASSLASAVLRATAKKNTSSSGSTKRVSIRTKGGKTINNPTLQDYGLAATQLGTILTEGVQPLVEKGMHAIFLSHENLASSENEDGVTIDAVGGPEWVGRKMTRESSKAFTVLLRIYAKREVGKPPRRVIATENDGLWVAKDRLRVLDPEGVDITVRRKEFKTAGEFNTKLLEQGYNLGMKLFNGQRKTRRVVGQEGK